MKKIILFVVIAIVSFNVDMKSQDKSNKFGAEGSYEVGPILGGYIFEDNSYNNSFMCGLRGLINITGKYALEGEIGLSSTNFNYTIENEGNIKHNDDSKIFNYCANFIYKYPLSRIAYAYGSFGIGGISFIIDKGDSNSDLYFNFGGGIKFLLGQKIALRLDIKQYAPSVDISFFSPRSGMAYFSPKGSPKADIQKIIQLNIGLVFLR